MKKQKVALLDLGRYLEDSKNYFRFHQNYSFTSLSLKEKRCLANIVKKIILIPDFSILTLRILIYLFHLSKKKEKIEKDLLEVQNFS